MIKNKFFICRHCGNLMGAIESSGVPMVCCGEEMQQLVPNTVDASAEKHLPAVIIADDTVHVKVGSSPHPMTQAHSIVWVYLQTISGGQRKCLSFDSEPEVTFALGGDTPIAVYSYCNLHGLWRTALN